MLRAVFAKSFSMIFLRIKKFHKNFIHLVSFYYTFEMNKLLLQETIQTLPIGLVYSWKMSSSCDDCMNRVLKELRARARSCYYIFLSSIFFDEHIIQMRQPLCLSINLFVGLHIPAILCLQCKIQSCAILCSFEFSLRLHWRDLV